MTRVEVLDHGYVELIDSWGSDEGIIEAARMSTGKGFTGWGPKQCECFRYTVASGCGLELPVYNADCLKCKGNGVAPGDEKLLKYLWDNRHATPFEMGGLTIEVQAPIFVFREWHRHRTQSYNEMSARYVPLPDVNYIPSVDRLLMGGGSNKQAGGTGATLTNNAETGFPALCFQIDLNTRYFEAEACYQRALAAGVPKELARLILPVGRYSRMRASANLRNWLAFLTLRMAPNAQWEIRQYANIVSDFVKSCFPRTHDLFVGGSNG